MSNTTETMKEPEKHEASDAIRVDSAISSDFDGSHVHSSA